MNDLYEFFNNRRLLGFDNLFRQLDMVMNRAEGTFPPYDIEEIGTGNFQITMAVAGFDANDIKVSLHKKTLSITAEQTTSPDLSPENISLDAPTKKTLHKGIAKRNFCQQFALADNVDVAAVSLWDGLLRITLTTSTKEEEKPKVFQITTNKA